MVFGAVLACVLTPPIFLLNVVSSVQHCLEEVDQIVVFL